MSALASRAGLVDPFGPPVDQLGALLRKMAEKSEQQPRASEPWWQNVVMLRYVPERGRYNALVCDGPRENHPEWIWCASFEANSKGYWGRTPEEAVEKALAAQPDRRP